MIDIVKQITPHIAKQFPAFYREEGETFIAFLEAYYEFLQQDETSFIYNSRRMYDINDIDRLVDESLNQFLWFFKEKYLDDFPFQSATDKAFMIKHIMDYHRSKGSPNSLKLLMRLLYNETADIYYPSKDVLRASDSDYHLPIYIEVTRAPNTREYNNKQIRGTKSGARAFVEGIVQKRVKGKIIDVLYLSGVQGTFKTGDVVVSVDDGVVKGSPQIKGSFSAVDINLGGRDNRVGDIFDVVTEEGVQGQIRITETLDATGRVDFKIEDQGFGYTAYDRDQPDSFESTSTGVYVADAMMFVDNSHPNYKYVDFETVYQPLETVWAISATDINANANTGDKVYGADANDVVVATGTILGIANTDGDNSNSAIISTASANTKLIIQVEEGSFREQVAIQPDSDSTRYSVGETIEEESVVTLTVDNVSGTISANDNVEQWTTTSYGVARVGDTMSVTSGSKTATVVDSSIYIKGQPLTQTGGTGSIRNNTFIQNIINATTIGLSKQADGTGDVVFNADTYKQETGYAFGRVQSANSTVVVVEEAWGEWQTDTLVEADDGDTFNVTQAVNTQPGARGEVVAKDVTNIYVNIDFGSFTVANKIRGAVSKVVRTVNSVNVSGAVDVWLYANGSANGVMTEIQDSRVEGIVIGQNDESVGAYGNTSAFQFENPPQGEEPTYTTILYTDRSKMISPPRFITYEPDFGLLAPAEFVAGIGFDLVDDLGGGDIQPVREKDIIVQMNVRLPYSMPDGILFEMGGGTAGITISTGEWSANTSKNTIWAIAGDYSDAAERFVIEVDRDDIPWDNELHEVTVLCTRQGSEKMEIYIDGFLVGTDDSSIWDSTAWGGTSGGLFGGTDGNEGLSSGLIPGAPASDESWPYVPQDCKIWVNQDANTVAVPGEIIELERQITRIAGGQSADFKIGVLEGTEDVTINTDMIDDQNVAGVEYVDILANGQGSGIGFVDSFIINDGGTQYSNGQSLTLEGGGYAGGDPTVAANVIIEETDGSGTITLILVDNPGIGYFEPPTVTLPNTSGTVANVEIQMDYGYGFPELPNGDLDNIIADCLTDEAITIGKIGLLTQINPGTEYTVDPFIKVHNKYIASFDRHDFIVIVDDVEGGFGIGEPVQQDIGGNTFAKGTVKAWQSQGDRGVLYINRDSFGISFDVGYSIVGGTLGGSANVISVSTENTNAFPIGADAVVSGTVINANGVAVSAEVLDSGFGYIDGDEVTFARADGDSPFVITGVTRVEQQGKGKGFWRSTTSHLSSEKKLQDNIFYQDYSYQVQSGLSMDRYQKRLQRLLHVAGTEMFGAVIKQSNIKAHTDASMTIEIS